MSTPSPSLFSPTLPGMLRINRGALIAVSVIGIVLGILTLALPSVGLLTIAFIFGSYLVASGVFRIVTAFSVSSLPVMTRWITGILGLLIVIAGVLALADPFASLFAVAILIGIGWLAEGIVDIYAAIRGLTKPTWYAWVSGIISVLAGIAMFLLPLAGLVVLVKIAAILLIIVSVSTLLMMPRRA